MKISDLKLLYITALIACFLTIVSSTVCLIVNFSVLFVCVLVVGIVAFVCVLIALITLLKKKK